MRLLRTPKWYLADLVIEFRIEGNQDNLVHYNLTLRRADSAEEAYSKALVPGSRQESSYKNPEGKQVQAWIKTAPDWLTIHDAADIEDPVLNTLDTGERAAIALGIALKADLNPD